MKKEGETEVIGECERKRGGGNKFSLIILDELAKMPLCTHVAFYEARACGWLEHNCGTVACHKVLWQRDEAGARLVHMRKGRRRGSDITLTLRVLINSTGKNEARAGRRAARPYKRTFVREDASSVDLHAFLQRQLLARAVKRTIIANERSRVNSSSGSCQGTIACDDVLRIMRYNPQSKRVTPKSLVFSPVWSISPIESKYWSEYQLMMV